MNVVIFPGAIQCEGCGKPMGVQPLQEWDPNVSHVLIVCGAYKDGEPLSGLFTLPEAAWELALGIYCAWKGFRLASPLARELVEHND